MDKKKCIGCAEILQTDNIDDKGYVPFEKYIMGGQIICRRCFRLKNYGQIPKEIEDTEEYKKIVKKIVNSVDVVMPIFDSIDLMSSMSSDIIDLLEDKRVYAILNKVDLLPKYHTITTISNWFKNILIEENIFTEEISYISTKNSFGLNGILRKLKTLAGKNKEIKVAVIGVSNVGKSSILNKLLKKEKLTTSKFSGTTKSSIKNTIKFKDITITIFDTPGLVPDGRIGAILPIKKAVKLVPSKEIKSRNINLKKDQYLMFSNLMYLKANSDVSINVFMSNYVDLHPTNEAKLNKLLTNDFFKFLDEKERDEYLKNEFITENICMDKYLDLSISGLGFIEIKNGIFDCDITYPKKLTIKTRNSISNANNEIEEELLW